MSAAALPVAAGIVAVGCGAALGAWLRWLLSVWLTGPGTALPWGTLAANLGGGFLVGMAVAHFGQHPGLAPIWRLFIVTGFLGGLTTFSSFSAESLAFLQRGDYGWAALHSGVHVVGSLLLCFAGHATYRALLHWE